jgi:hypothetical protein
MIGVTLPNSAKNTFTYDADGLRRQSQTPALVTKFIWDRQDVLMETDGIGTTQAVYTGTPDMYGSLISQRRASNTSYYSFDSLGSTSELTNGSEN